MELHDLFNEIESDAFQSRFMIFSGFRLVRNALSRDPTVKLLINEIRLNPQYDLAIAERIFVLYSIYRNDVGAAFDIAAAAYLLSLYLTNQDYAKAVSEYILEMGKLWWSVDLSLRIRRNMELFAEPSKRKFTYSGYAAANEHITWSPPVVQKPTYEAILVGVNGEELWNMSGQLSVSSPQKTETLMHSV